MNKGQKLRLDIQEFFNLSSSLTLDTPVCWCMCPYMVHTSGEILSGSSFLFQKASSVPGPIQRVPCERPLLKLS